MAGRTSSSRGMSKTDRATVRKAKVLSGASMKRGARVKAGARDRGLTLLPKAKLLEIMDLMVKSRVLEERLIKVYKTGDAFFWIGGPGEEAFGVSLGMHVDKGHGPAHDFLHLHYRCTPTLIAMGMPMIDSLRLIMNRATDPSTGGRNFANHYCFPKWNVVPVSSPIEVQYGMAVGTGLAQRRRRLAGEKSGVSIITGGDAGTAEGDFASCLIWSSRPGAELPMYITVQNNKWGISTSFDAQHGEKHIADRGKAFGIRTSVVNGNDPVEAYLAIEQDLAYIRKTGRPVLTEFMVSRLYGHSSASGANREAGEDCVETFEKRLVDARMIPATHVKELWQKYDDESRAAAEQVRSEPVPTPESVWEHVYVGSENGDWRKF
ncbi:MAG TPA: thiamine pyrophosphate-dependent enzyme [Pseudobdellovibrionaceae bacterium]|nr:thiamine pyrophosphate-dependent enzyme [Pseudobdellovibrionaceae bacterium]